MDHGEAGAIGVNVVKHAEAGNNIGLDNVTILFHSIMVQIAKGTTVQIHNHVEHNTVQVCVANDLIKSL